VYVRIINNITQISGYIFFHFELFIYAKNKISFQTSEIVKEAVLEGADHLSENFKNKSEIVTTINDLH